MRPKTPATKFAAFLGHLAEGHTIAAASRYACVARSTAYERRNTDKEFAAAWAEAEDTGIEVAGSKFSVANRPTYIGPASGPLYGKSP